LATANPVCFIVEHILQQSWLTKDGKAPSGTAAASREWWFLMVPPVISRMYVNVYIYETNPIALLPAAATSTIVTDCKFNYP